MAGGAPINRRVPRAVRVLRARLVWVEERQSKVARGMAVAMCGDAGKCAVFVDADHRVLSRCSCCDAALSVSMGGVAQWLNKVAGAGKRVAVQGSVDFC